MIEKHENILHQIADELIDYFDSTDAVNYIEQTFECNDDPSKSFVLTMQIKEGLTPCQKLANAEARNRKLACALIEVQRIAEFTTKDKAILNVVDNVIDDINSAK